jgi:Rrf2 family nitric oxide-sensitive transcriptional repressor
MDLFSNAARPVASSARVVGVPAGPYDAPVQLTSYTDYALRTLMYLGVHAGRAVSAAEIASAYGISAHHVAKVGKALVRGGFVRAQRGRAGGLELATAASAIPVGRVVRFTENTIDLLECFDRARSTCPLTGACRLERTLHQAQAAFFDVLDRVTIADLVAGAAPTLAGRLGARAVSRVPVARPRARAGVPARRR